MASCELFTLGEALLVQDGAPVRLRTRREFALLAYLAHERARPVRREDLADLLWSGSDHRRKLHSLSQTLYGIRSRIGAGPIQAGPEAVSVDPALLSIDSRTFETLVARGEWRSATDMYRGDFLATLTLTGAAEFEHWRDGVAAGLRELHFVALRECLRVAEERGDWALVGEAAARLLDADPFDEDVIASRIRAFALAGQPARAAAELDRAIGTFKREFGRLPGQRLLRLSESILAVPVRIENSDGAQAPFVGRGPEFSRLRSAWERVKGGAGTVVAVLGSAGIGKTRLCREFLRTVKLAGARVCVGRCFQAESGLPYGPLADALGDELHEGDLKLLAPAWVDVLAGSLPELAVFGHREPRVAAAAAELEQRRFFEAVARLLEEIAARQPLILHIDDAQWADDSTGMLLHYLARRLVHSRVLLLLALRPDEVPRNSPIDHLVSAHQPARGAIQIHLGDLDDAAVDALVAAILGCDRDQPAEARSRLRQRTGGHPFFTIELLKAIRDADGAANTDEKPWSDVAIPESIEAFLRLRMRRLDRDARDAAGAIAVLGRQATHARVAALLRSTPEQLLQPIETLIAAGLIHEDDDEIEFEHDLVRELIYNDLGALRRRHLHRSAASILEQEGSVRPGVIALHYNAAGEKDHARRFALAAAEESRAIHAHKEAESFLRLARENATDTASLLETTRLLADYLHELHRYPDADQLYAELEAAQVVGGKRETVLATAIQRAEIQLHRGQVSCATLLDRFLALDVQLTPADPWKLKMAVGRALISLAHDLGKTDIVLEQLPRLSALTRQSNDLVAAVEAAVVTSTYSTFYETSYHSMDMIESTVAVAKRSHNATAIMAALLARSAFHLQNGRLSCAERDLVEAQAISDANAIVTYKQAVLNNLGLVFIERGEYSRARDVLQDAIALGEEAEDIHTQVYPLINLAISYLEDDDIQQAYSCAERAFSVNRTYTALWSDLFSFALMGLCALALHDFTDANLMEREILRLLRDTNPRLTDASYVEAFLARMAVRRGEREAALARLDAAIEDFRERDVFCRLRLEVERASVLAGLDPARAREAAERVREEARRLGARPLVEKAERVLDRLEYAESRVGEAE